MQLPAGLAGAEGNSTARLAAALPVRAGQRRALRAGSACGPSNAAPGFSWICFSLKKNEWHNPDIFYLPVLHLIVMHCALPVFSPINCNNICGITEFSHLPQMLPLLVLCTFMSALPEAINTKLSTLRQQVQIRNCVTFHVDLGRLWETTDFTWSLKAS